MIYIDPPYNTGNDSFVYPDDYSERSDEFNKRTGITDENGFLNKQDLWQKNNKENGRFHSVWLSMMYPRLYLARNLLREDGVIFISIDDNEASNLKLICDEVFGEENFVSQLVWQKAKKGDAKLISKNHEYVFVYCKNTGFTIENSIWRVKKEGVADVLTYYKSLKIRLKNDHSTISEEMRVWYSSLPKNDPKRSHAHYRFSDNRGLYFADNFGRPDDGRLSRPRYDIIHPVTGKSCKKPSTGWRWDEERTKKALESTPQLIHFGVDETTIPCRKSYLEEVDSEPFSSVFYKDGRGGTLEVEKLIGKGMFDFPKDVPTLKSFLKLTTESDDIILDFFAGSGTTAQAIMEINEEDGGNRQFICVQMPEVLEENSEAHKAGYKTIADITKARISKVIEKITTERESKLELETRQPLGFNAYKLTPSNFKIWRSDIQGKDAILEQLQVFQSSEKSDSPQENMLTELLLKTGLGLGVKYIQEQSFYKVGNLWICFEKFQPEMKEQILQGNVQKVIFLNSCFASDAELSNLQLELKENEINLVII